MMSREEIIAKWDELTPRERDAWIAEVVFGWRRIKGPKTDYDGLCEYGDVLIPPEITSEEEAFRLMPPKASIPFTYFVNRKWSTDIPAAWTVLDEIPGEFYLYRADDGRFVASFGYTDEECPECGEDAFEVVAQGKADIAPEAIGLAAIIAKICGGDTKGNPI